MANRVVTRITTFTEVSILQLAAMGPFILSIQNNTTFTSKNGDRKIYTRVLQKVML